MAMVTTCPHCTTTFNVEPDVLLSRNGRVRCGRCKQVFDGLLSAVTLAEFQSKIAVDVDAAVGDAVPGVTPVVGTPTAAPTAPEPEPARENYWPALPETPEAPEAPVPPMPLEIAAAASASHLPQQQVEEDMQRPEVAPQDLQPTAPVPVPTLAPSSPGRGYADSHYEFDDAEPPTPRTRWPWAIAATFAGLLLAGQILYRYRIELAANYPVTKPVFVQVCAWAGCRVAALQQPAALNIEASDLQVIDKARPHLVQLTATVRNRAAIDIGYPALDLVLTDNREHALARRVITPADYLPGPQVALSTIAANAEVTMRVDMDIGDLPAAGFRLNLTHAPIP